MTAKEYLSQINKWQWQIESISARSADRIRRLGDRIEELYNQASGLKGLAYDKDRVQVSQENQLEKIWIQIEEASDKMKEVVAREKDTTQKRIDAIEKKIRNIEDQIDGIDRSEYAQILRMRYVDGKNLLQITLELKDPDGGQRYAYDYIRHMHGWALLEFEKKYLNVTK